MRIFEVGKSVAALRLSGLVYTGVSTRLQRSLGLAALIAVLLPASGWAQDLAQYLAQNSTVKPAAVSAGYGKLPLSFEANQGQSAAAVKFMARGNGYSLFLTDSAAVLSMSKGSLAHARPTSEKPDAGHSSNPGFQTPGVGHPDLIGTDVMRMELVGSTKSAPISGTDRLEGIANYFIGNDPGNWHANVPTYGRVKYSGVYPGIDLIYYGNQRQLEYDFVVAPSADAKLARLRFSGIERLRLSAHGDLIVIAANGKVTFQKPVVYQVVDGERVGVDGRFALMAKNEVGFALGKYDRRRELVIDPVLSYSTYLGGAGSDVANAIAVDKSGDAYVTGYTMSTAFPTVTPYEKSNNDAPNGVAFVSKLNAAGTALIYSTYLGGSGGCSGVPVNSLNSGDVGNSIAVDASGDAYVAGQTCSASFPTLKPFQAANGKPSLGNGFVTKLNPAGDALVYSTYLGGSNGRAGDYVQAIAVDASGDAYVAGQAFSTNFPTTAGAYAPKTMVPNNNTGFVTKLNATGSALTYSTYLGNNVSTGLYAIAVDGSGEAYVAGYTIPGGYPVTKNAYQAAYPGNNTTVGVFTKLNSAGSALVYSTYLGGSGTGSTAGDLINGIAVDASGNAYLAGFTYSTNFPVLNAYQKVDKAPAGGYSGFVSKINATSGALVYSTYLGGSGNGRITALALDSKDDVFVTGFSFAADFPTTSGAFQTKNGAITNKATNAFLTELSPAGSGLTYSTYLGGSGTTSGNGDSSNGIGLDSLGNPYIAGYAYSANFPTSASAYQKAIKASAGKSNAVVAKITFVTASATTLTADVNPQKVGVGVTFTAYVPAAAGSSIVPTGTVGFSIDNGTAINVTLDDTGHAAYKTTTLAEGVHSVTAMYAGDDNYASSSATYSETIYGSASMEKIVSGSPQTVAVGATSAPLVVIVKDAKGDVVPGVVVTFSGTGVKLSSATATTGSNGEASITVVPTVAGTLTVKAAAAGVAATVSFTVNAISGTAPEPTASQVITIADALSGATVYYTTNGTTPTTASTKYTGPITLTSTETLKFIAVKAGYANSAVRTITDTVQ